MDSLHVTRNWIRFFGTNRRAELSAAALLIGQLTATPVFADDPAPAASPNGQPAVLEQVAAPDPDGQRADLSGLIDQWLNRWEQDSAKLERPSNREARLHCAGALSKNESDIVADLQGPVLADNLRARFHWQLGKTPQGPVLIGHPRDPVEALFLGRIEVLLNESAEVQALRLANRGETNSNPNLQLAGGRGPTAGEVIQASDSTTLTPVGDETAAESVLREWERATSDIQNLKLTFDRIRIDRASHTEWRNSGTFVFVGPNRGTYRLKHSRLDPEAASLLAGHDGGRFQLRSEVPVTLHWDGSSLVVVDETDRTYQALVVPKPESLVRPVGSWDMVWQHVAAPQRALPGLVSVNADRLMLEHRWSVLASDDHKVLLRAVPIDSKSRHRFSEIQIALDSDTHLTRATREFDASGNIETVYVFHYEMINRPEVESGDWKPNLASYSPLELPPPAPAAD